MKKSKYCHHIIPIVVFIWFSTSIVLSQAPTAPNYTAEKKTPTQKESTFLPKIPDVLEKDLLGKVRSTKDLSYIPELKFEKWETGKPYMTLSENYDLNGYYSSSILSVYRGVETVADKAFRELDNHYFAESENPRISIVNFKYDYENKIIFEERKVSDSPNDDDSRMQLEKLSTKYSVGGKTGFDAEGKMTWKEIVIDEPNGRRTTTLYREDGSIEEKTIVKGSETSYENIDYFGGGWKERSFMNKTDNVTERWIFDKKKKVPFLDKRTIRSDTPRGIVETEINFNQGKEYLRLVKVYKKMPKLEMEYMQTPKTPYKNTDGDTVRSYHFKYEYKFDPNGNWTEKTEMHKVSKFGKAFFEPFRIVRREISYYE